MKIADIRPKRARAPYAAGHGEVARLVFDTLRDAEEAVTSRELAIRLMTERGLDVTDRELTSMMVQRVRACIKAHRLKGAIRGNPSTDGTYGWELVR